MRKSIFLSLFLVAEVSFAQVGVHDANGEHLGYFLGSSPDPSITAPSTTYHLLSPGGYRYFLSVNYPQGDGRIIPYWNRMSPSLSHVRFESEDCTGQAFMAAGYTGFITQDTSELREIWYAPHDGVVQERIIRSSFVNLNENCRTEPDPLLLDVVPVTPNDPSVTGLESGFKKAPIALEASVKDCLFQDRFECY